MDINQMQGQEPGGAPMSPPGVEGMPPEGGAMPPDMGAMPPAGMPENMGMEEAMPEPPMEEIMDEPMDDGGSSKTDGLKRQLLQKLMSNLLSKPGRSVHELVNGVKDVLGAYKNYAKEIDSLSGITEAPIEPTSDGSNSGGDIQSILDKIQASKAGGAEGIDSAMPPTMPPAGGPSPVPPAGGPEMPPMGAGGPGYSRTGYTQPPPVSRLGIWGY